MDLGPHAAFIWLSYLAVVMAMAGLIGWLLLDGRRHERRLAELEARGVRRRSATRRAGPDGNDASGAG